MGAYVSGNQEAKIFNQWQDQTLRLFRVGRLNRTQALRIDAGASGFKPKKINLIESYLITRIDQGGLNLGWLRASYQ